MARIIMTQIEARQGGDFPSPGASISQIHTVRVVAMLGVFLHHLWNTVILTPAGPVQWGLDVLFDTASDGVILFNMLSGFLLALPYLGPERRPFVGYGNFLHRRFLRIVPPYFLALVLFSMANVLVFGIPPVSALHNLLLHLSFLNSLDYSIMSTNFSHFWYLGMLAQFYLLFPLFLHFFQRVGSTTALIRIVGVCWGGWSLLGTYLAWYPDSALGMAGYLMHFNLPGRLPEFAAGMWLASRCTTSVNALRAAIFHRPFSLVFLGLGAGVILGAPFVSGVGLPLAHIYHVALCVVLVVLLIVWAQAAVLGRMAFILKLSAHSYAIYIVHEPLFSYVGVMPSRVSHTLGTFFALAVLLLGLSYVAAMALEKLSRRVLQRYTEWTSCDLPAAPASAVSLNTLCPGPQREEVLAAKHPCRPFSKRTP